ncbi:MAG: phosphopyruvate hydratase, partial [Candidatus Micrarchaeota archaeon]
MPKISRVYGRQVLDSRGNPAVQANIVLDNGVEAKAIAPSGASTGKLEAIELRDNGKEFFGKGVTLALRNVGGAINSAIKGLDIENQEKIDAAMIEADGTANKARLGANATTAVSFAALRAHAYCKKKGIYEILGGNILPVPFMNVINGGKHAGNSLAVQEFMIAPLGFKNFPDALRAGVETYHVLKGIIKKQYGPSGINVGDEGGFAPMIAKSEDALNLLEDAIDEAGYSGKVKIGCDAAASEFYNEKTKSYKIDGQELREEGMHDYWDGIVGAYPLISLEDPFDEHDFYNFAKLRE